MKCKKCGYENKKEANFCIYCGNKLKDACNCWVKKKDNYDCGESSCLGYDLLVKEVKMKNGAGKKNQKVKRRYREENNKRV